MQRNRIERDELRRAAARPTDDTTETIECDLVLRSVGYRAVPLPDVPFDERNYVLPNDEGRVLDADSGAVVPGVYAVGWIKRGPTGILGTNKRDANETVGHLLEDLDQLPAPESPARRPSTRCWPRRRPAWSRSTVGARSTRSSASAAKRGPAAGQAGRGARSCWKPRLGRRERAQRRRRDFEPCGTEPMTGFFRDGCCRTGPDNVGSHTICAVVTEEFLDHQRGIGNDLTSPVPQFHSPACSLATGGA